MSNRGAKPTKNMQINFMRDKLDEFGESMYWINQYFTSYGITGHFQAWIKAKAEDIELPPKLIVDAKPDDSNPSS